MYLPIEKCAQTSPWASTIWYLLPLPTNPLVDDPPDVLPLTPTSHTLSVSSNYEPSYEYPSPVGFHMEILPEHSQPGSIILGDNLPNKVPLYLLIPVGGYP